MSRRAYLSAGVGALLFALFLAPAVSAQAGSPYAAWSAGPSTDPNWFAIGVWYQWYGRISEYQGIGLTMFTTPDKPAAADLTSLKNAGMGLLTNFDANLLSVTNRGVIKGWILMDEPDNAQPNGSGGWGPCIDPSVVIAQYNAIKAADPNRPVFLNLGQGVCWPWSTPYYGRGSGSTWAQYAEYVKGGDIISFDVYPYNERTTDAPYQKPWYVAVGVDRLRNWTNNQKPIWVFIETTHIDSNQGPTWRQTKGETWIALVHGAMGIQYFAHSWYPSFREDAIFSTNRETVDPNMSGALKQLDAQVKSYAPLLYSPTVGGYLDPNGSVNNMDKSDAWTTTVFSVAMRDQTSLTGAVKLSNMPGSLTAEVLEEGRTVPVTNGIITDNFSNLAVHIYRLPMPEAASTWNSAAGNWKDANRWSAGEPNALIRAIVSNGGTATINSAGLGKPLYTILGLTSSQSGNINMTAGSLRSSVAYIGYDGRGTFTQSGGAYQVDGNLYLGQTRGAVGLYNLSDGNLTVAGAEYAGYAGNGVFTQTGGRHAVSGPLYLGYASDANAKYNLAGGQLVAPNLTVGTKGVLNLSGGALLKSATDANLLGSITSSGLIDVTSGDYLLSSIVCPDANDLTGTVRIEAGATLWVSSISQSDIYVSGTLVLGGTPSAGALAGPLTGGADALDPTPQAVPEPCALALLGLGGLAVLRRRRHA